MGYGDKLIWKNAQENKMKNTGGSDDYRGTHIMDQNSR